MGNRTVGRVTAGGALLLAALAGCSGERIADTSAAAPAVPSFTTTPATSTGTSTTSETSALPTTTDAGPTTSAPASQAPAVQSAPPASPDATDCRATELALSVRDGNAAAGTVYRDLVFTNKGARTCIMQGFPGVSYVTGENGQQVGPAAFRVGRKGAPVTLPPGGTAAAPLGFVNVRNFDPAACRPTEIRGLRVYPPHDTAALFVPLSGLGCAGTPPDNQLTVKTVV